MEIAILIAIIAGTPSIVVSALLGWREFRSGSSKISTEVISNYKTLDDQQKANIQECRDNLVGATKAMHDMETKFVDRISNLEGVVSEKDKQLQNVTQILANRNPKLEQTLEDIRNFMKNMNDINVSQLTILQTSQKRDMKQDKNKKEKK